MCASSRRPTWATTEKRAVDELFSLGAEIRVAMDARTTKLHAKAWLLERASGLTTAFVGSSNLSHTALFDGLEWNVRLVVDGRDPRDRPGSDVVREPLGLRALRPLRPGGQRRRARASAAGARPSIARRGLDDLVRQPRRPSLPAPAADARRADGRTRASRPTSQPRCRGDRNRQDGRRRARLPPAARAGTGELSLLFVAHREEILRQSLATYRAVLRRRRLRRDPRWRTRSLRAATSSR